jgi:hypothetical protein
VAQAPERLIENSIPTKANSARVPSSFDSQRPEAGIQVE